MLVILMTGCSRRTYPLPLSDVREALLHATAHPGIIDNGDYVRIRTALPDGTSVHSRLVLVRTRGNSVTTRLRIRCRGRQRRRAVLQQMDDLLKK